MAKQLIGSIQASNDEEFKKAMQAECLELLGDIEFHDNQKNYEKALEYYYESCNLKGSNVNIYIKLGKTYEKLREFDEAITNLRKAIRRDKKNFTAYYRLGLCYIRNNMREEGV